MVEENYFTLIASTYYCLISWIKGIRGLGIIIVTLGCPFFSDLMCILIIIKNVAEDDLSKAADGPGNFQSKLSKYLVVDNL